MAEDTSTSSFEDVGKYIKYIKRSYFQVATGFKPYHEISRVDYATFGASSNSGPDGQLLVVSHVWETRAEPDLLNWQFKEVKSFLEGNKEFEYVFYDYSSIPQKKSLLDEYGRPIPDKNGEDTKTVYISQDILPHVAHSIFKQILMQMDELYCGLKYPKSTRVINLCPTELYTQRTWPYFEIFCATLYGTLVGGCSPLPIVEYCKELAKLRRASGLPERIRDLQALLKSSTFRSPRIQDAIGQAIKEIEEAHVDPNSKRVEENQEEYRGWGMQQLFGTVDVSLRLQKGVLVAQMAGEVLVTGLIYELLGTTVTNQSDRDTIIKNIQLKKQQHMTQFEKFLDGLITI